VPRDFMLRPNHPNPFNANTKLNTLGNGIDIVVYNLLGEQIQKYDAEPGDKTVMIQLGGYADGIYFIAVYDSETKRFLGMNKALKLSGYTQGGPVIGTGAPGIVSKISDDTQAGPYDLTIKASAPDYFSEDVSLTNVTRDTSLYMYLIQHPEVLFQTFEDTLKDHDTLRAVIG